MQIWVEFALKSEVIACRVPTDGLSDELARRESKSASLRLRNPIHSLEESVTVFCLLQNYIDCSVLSFVMALDREEERVSQPIAVVLIEDICPEHRLQI